MATQAEIKNAMDRVRDTFNRRPELKQGTSSASCQVVSGLASEGKIGERRFAVDVPETVGGTDAGPNPGGLALVAVASCLAIGCAMTFADRGLKASRIDVTVDADLDFGSGLGLGGHVGFKKLRCTISIDSDEDPEAIRDAVAATKANSPVTQSFAQPVPVETTLELNGACAAAE